MGGMNCGSGGHSSSFGGRMFVCAFLGSILGAFKVYHRQNLKILINVLNVKLVRSVHLTRLRWHRFVFRDCLGEFGIEKVG